MLPGPHLNRMIKRFSEDIKIAIFNFYMSAFSFVNDDADKHDWRQ